MAIKIQYTDEIDFYGVKMLIFGPPGVGKTRLLATAPNPIIISTEKGLLSLKDKRIPFIEISTLQEMSDAYDAVMQADFETVCLDSVTEILETLFRKLKRENIKRAESEGKKADHRQVYLQVAESAIAMMCKFRDIDDKNVIFIAQETIREKDDAETFEPSMPGRMLPRKAPHLFDEVFSMQTQRRGGKEVTFLQTYKDSRRNCKDRSGALDKKEVPDLSAIINKIKGGK